MVLDLVFEVLRLGFVTLRRRARPVASGDRLGIQLRFERLEGVVEVRRMPVASQMRRLYCCSRTSPF